AGEGGGAFNVFIMRANWFSLEQTEGAEFVPEIVVPSWDAATALGALGIVEEPFQSVQGNVLGYATTKGSIAISPLNPLKHKTRFHEMAHIVLGHTEEAAMTDTPATPRDIREAEAEGVAYILCALLDLPGQAESRHYIQSWLDGRELPEKSARKVFGAADRIMKAGQPVSH
ncbi:MAG: ImmA/IrrE family metallo-endopeptidase, partial [Caldimonas sp.]